ncbi:MAG: carbon-nitrogen hydrolase family protein [Rhodospirillales bacterium]
MTAPFRVACVQTNSAREIALNIEPVVDLIRRARGGGADLVCLPENVSLMEPISRLMREKAPAEEDHPALAAYRKAAQANGVWLLIGSLTVRFDGGRLDGDRVEDGRLANRSLLIDADGAIVARYDKIHLFDVDLGPDESYRESATIAPGDRTVVAATPWGRLGLSVCYDLRFPQLYRRLAQAGAGFFAIPAAFTRTTGQAHWHVLQRARAIENGAWVFAPAQCGVHAEGRETYGHSLIVDPWGQIVADGGEDVGVIVAGVDPQAAAAARRRIPSLQHDRPFS